MLKFLDDVLPHLYWIFSANLGENATGINSDFQLQYKLNETMANIFLTFEIS